MKHYVSSNIVTGGITSILLVGAGGTGSQIVSGLARMNRTLLALGHKGIHLEVMDGDAVSASNVGRQLYSPADAGLNKAVVQVTRMNNFFGTAWVAYPWNLEADMRASRGHQIIITAVDSVSARSMAARLGTNGDAAYWLDTGNTAHTGQVVLGNFFDMKQPDPALPGQTSSCPGPLWKDHGRRGEEAVPGAELLRGRRDPEAGPLHQSVGRDCGPGDPLEDVPEGMSDLARRLHQSRSSYGKEPACRPRGMEVDGVGAKETAKTHKEIEPSKDGLHDVLFFRSSNITTVQYLS